MITDVRAAEVCMALYGDISPAVPVQFDVVDMGLDDGICWALTREDDTDVIVLRGSVTPEDWLRDVMASPYPSRRIGRVHRGFWLGLDNAWQDIRGQLRPQARVAVVGHSLGAARSTLLAGIMLADARPPDLRVAFGEPRPGFQDLAEYVRSIPARSFRNGSEVAHRHDLVTSLPFGLPRLGLDYVHTTPLIDVYAEPPPDDRSGMFAYHHIELYLAALINREKTK